MTDIITGHTSCCIKDPAKDGLIFDENSPNSQSSKFQIKERPRLIRGFKIPEGQSLCVEIEHYGEWEPWKCPGAQCKITTERCRLVISEPGSFRLVAEDANLGFGSVEAISFNGKDFPNLLTGGCCT